MGQEVKTVQRPSTLVPYGEFLAALGKGETTGWRWRRDGLIETVNICGKIYVTTDEITRFESRALSGEFRKAVSPPRNLSRSM